MPYVSKIIVGSETANIKDTEALKNIQTINQKVTELTNKVEGFTESTYDEATETITLGGAGSERRFKN